METRRYGTNPTLETRSDSFETVDKDKRYKQIIEILKEHKNGLTAKEIAVEMMLKKYTPTSERNFTAPRLTELSKKGIVEPIGKKKCQYTNKTVSIFALREGQTTIYDFI